MVTASGSGLDRVSNKPQELPSESGSCHLRAGAGKPPPFTFSLSSKTKFCPPETFKDGSNPWLPPTQASGPVRGPVHLSPETL